MICPNCKNEKWDADTCSQCGLDERAALLSSADGLRKDGKWRKAAEAYDRYLKLYSDRTEVRRRKASCLSQEAARSLDPALFESANVDLGQVLEEDWGWEEGHRLRMDLFYKFGKLEDLRSEYEQMELKDENRAAFSAYMSRVIRLTEQFKKNPPIVHSSLEEEGGRFQWFKNYWPLVTGLPLVLLAVVKVSSLPRSNGGNSFLFLFLTYLMLGIIVLALFFATMQLRKGEKKNPMGDIEIDPTNRP